MNSSELRFLADESCDFAIVRALRTVSADALRTVTSTPAGLLGMGERKGLIAAKNWISNATTHFN